MKSKYISENFNVLQKSGAGLSNIHYFNTLAQNEYTIKDSLQVNQTELLKVLKLLESFELVDLFDEVYWYFFFGVISLFNSAHLIKTIHIF